MGSLSQHTTEQTKSASIDDTPQVEPEPERKTGVTDTADSTSASIQESASPVDDETAKRQAHEAAEAKRRAEWKAEQEKKRAAEREQLDRLAAMSDEAVIAAAVGQVSDATDKMTNRSMKESVSAHIQAKCQEDPAFARLTMHPRKSMLHCIQYIFRQAKDYLEKELKAGGITVSGTYGGDVPDGLCYQWAEDYFRDPDAKEDHADDDKFIERPYYGGRTAKTKSTSASKAASKSTSKATTKAKNRVDGQISLLDGAGT